MSAQVKVAERMVQSKLPWQSRAAATTSCLMDHEEGNTGETSFELDHS
jgi:hypothetical protein